MDSKIRFIAAAYKDGKLTAEVRNIALDYLHRFPTAAASHAVSFAKLRVNIVE